MTHIRGTAVITGASAGIGKTYADRFASRGYNLILVARRSAQLKEIASDLHERYSVNVETVVADLSTVAGIDVVADLLRFTPHIKVLVNNAGTSTLGEFTELATDGLIAMDMLNVHALSRLTHAVLPTFKKNNAGTLINIGSVLGFQSLPVSTAYSATKSYVHAFTRGLQQELASTHIRVQLVLPAATATDIWEISGVPLSALDASTIMTVDDCVDAALAGLDLGESVTMPSVEKLTLLDAFDQSRTALLVASQTGIPAERYKDLDRA